MTEDGFYDRPQVYFEWPVPDKGFVWVSNLKDISGHTPKPHKPPFLLPQPDTTLLNLTFPLEDHTTLFTEFAELDLDKDSILKFANEHGNLNDGILLAPKKKATTLSEGRVGVPLSTWRAEISEMTAYLKLWDAVSRQDKKALADYIEWEDRETILYHFRDVLLPRDLVKFTGQEHYTGTLATAESKPDLFKMFVCNDVLLPARHLLQKRINDKMEIHSVMPRLILNPQGQIDSYLMPESLIAALWLQFYHAAAHEQRFRRCELCGKYENISGRRTDWVRHASCASKIRAARSYERQKAAKKKATAKRKAAK